MNRKLAVACTVGFPMLALILGGAASTGAARTEAGNTTRGTNGLDSTMWTTMRNVDLRIGKSPDQPGAMRVRTLRGRVIPTDSAKSPFLDDPESFGIEVSSGTVALDGAALTTLLNERVFGYRGSPIRNLRVTVENGQLKQRGTIRKGVDLGFTMWSTLTLTPDNRIRSHPTRLILMGVNGLTLLHALGLKMEKVLDVRGTNGIVQMDGDDMILDALRMIPPPRVTGRIADVKIEGDEVVQTFATTPSDSVFENAVRVDPSVQNYIYYKGATLRFGRLTMWPTDLLIGDADESDRFDLDLQRYSEQLTAGYTRTLPNKALRTWMPDRHDLRNGQISPPGDARGGTPMRPPR
jgi:hypothetical protein